MWASKRGLVGLPFIALAMACAGNPAPRGWLAPAPDAISDPYGAWVNVDLASAEQGAALRGELIAVALDSIFVLTLDAEFHAIARADVTRARVAYYSSQHGQLAAWTIIGSLATLSHGFFLVFSFPVWAIGGSVTTGGQSRAPLADVGENKHSWDAVTKYARFPQGLPSELDRGRLRPKLQR